MIKVNFTLCVNLELCILMQVQISTVWINYFSFYLFCRKYLEKIDKHRNKQKTKPIRILHPKKVDRQYIIQNMRILLGRINILPQRGLRGSHKTLS